MVECPDNSTECLLRAVLEGLKQNQAAVEEGNAGYNWDPATFALTLVIGVLAFVVACLTVFQGLLAAGPGRIKAGRSAIGPWSRLSKSRFSRSELGIRTTAESPVLDRIWEGRQRHMLNYQDPKTKTSNQSFYRQYGSSWATLLHRLECNYATFPTRRHNTDYLPADIPGVPALGRISTLVIMTALADDYCTVSVSSAKRYAEVECPNSALRMRDHSQLGTIAVFETWGNPNTLSKPSSDKSCVFKNEASALQNLGEAWGLGFARRLFRLGNDVNDPPIADIRSRSAETFMFGNSSLAHSGLPSIPLNMISFRLPARPRLFPKQSLNLAKIVMQLSHRSFWRTSDYEIYRVACIDLMENIWHSAIPPFDYQIHASFDNFTRRAYEMVDLVEDNPYLHWTRWTELHTLRVRTERDTASPEPSPASLQVSGACSAYINKYILCVEEFCDTKEKLPKDPLFLRVIPQSLAKGARAEMQLALQVLIKHIDLYLVRQNVLDVRCALLALTRSMAIANKDYEASVKPPLTRPKSPSQPSSPAPNGSEPPPSQSGIEKGYQPRAEFDMPKAAYDEAYLDSLHEASAYLGATISPSERQLVGHVATYEYKPGDMNKIALLAETLRMRGLLVAAVLDLCADSTPFLDEKFDDRLVAFI